VRGGRHPRRTGAESVCAAVSGRRLSSTSDHARGLAPRIVAWKKALRWESGQGSGVRGSARIPGKAIHLQSVPDGSVPGTRHYNRGMSSYFTRQGDDGYTGILGEGRVAKYDARPEMVGTLDEASAALGLARSLTASPLTADLILAMQRDLYHAMAEAAAEPDQAPRFRVIDAERVAWLERQAQEIERALPPVDGFVIPGDCPASAALDLARTVVRRAERHVARMTHEGKLSNPELLRYLNRLSSVCFLLELRESRESGREHPTMARGE
jgi:cob(I)alamin adenosyltransferase